MITAVETLLLAEHPEYIWVRLETDGGLVGLGETMPRPGPVRRVIHDVLAPLLLGHDEGRIELNWQRQHQAVSYHGYAGAEFRAVSAIDMALWDLLGKRAGLPVWQLLGGACRDTLPVYNTCVSRSPFTDHERFLEDPAGLARELLREGLHAMKVWPFDELSTATLGQSLPRSEARKVVERLLRVRDAVGDDLEIAIEGHACWNLPAAIRLAEALEPVHPMWLEDLLPPEQPLAWAELRRSTPIPICGSERLFGRWQFAALIDAGGVDVVMPDVGWCGGITEFRRIAALASARLLPIAPHNCHGPVAAAATFHAAAATPNLQIVETVRSFARTFHGELATGAVAVTCGEVSLPRGPGLGVELRPDAFREADVERSEGGRALEVAWAEGDPWKAGQGERV